MRDMVIELKDGTVIELSEGTGDNLLHEDIEEGYIDYLYYNIYPDILAYKRDEEYDGGQILLTRYAADMTDEEAILLLCDMEAISETSIVKVTTR